MGPIALLIAPGQLEGGGDGPAQHPFIAQLGADDARGERRQLLEPSLQRLAQQVEAATDAPAHHHRVGVEHGGDGGDDEGEALRLALDRGPGRRHTAAGRVEDLPG